MNQLPLEKIRIWQQNMNRSLTGQVDFLNVADPRDYEIILLQEPYIDPRTSLTRANHHWHVIYPTGHHDRDQKSRSIILVNATISTNSWTALEIDSPDLTGLTLRTSRGPLFVFNIYNDQSHDDTLRCFETTLTTLARNPEQLGYGNLLDAMILWAGDFNRHHPFWELTENQHLMTRNYLDDAQLLVDLVAEYGLD